VTEVLSSRVLLHPADFAQSLRFYRETLGLAVYREWGTEGAPGHGIVFFLGGGYLELSGRSQATPGDKLELWLQVRSADETHRALAETGVTVDEPPTDKPWGLREMRIRDPDGVRIVVVQVPDDHPLRHRPEA